MENKMKAIVCPKYGPPEVLQLKEVEKPTPKDNEVQVKVHAASLNNADLDFLRGSPSARMSGPLRPRYKIPGSDIAGRVEAVGRNVKQFQPGDEIFGDSFMRGFGAFAEYVCVSEKAIALKPASMKFEEVATIPQAGVLALQGICDKKEIQPGQKVLINGAGGGVGTFAVQIAKSFGAEVTGVDSMSKLDKMRSIGADKVIDYTQEDFTKSGQCYDLILDVQAHHSVFAYKRALNPKGIYLMVGGSKASLFQAVFLGPLISMTTSKKLGILGWKPNIKNYEAFIELFEAGKVKPVIDRRYALSETAEAYRYIEEGNQIGKLVITVEHEN